MKRPERWFGYWPAAAILLAAALGSLAGCGRRTAAATTPAVPAANPPAPREVTITKSAEEAPAPSPQASPARSTVTVRQNPGGATWTLTDKSGGTSTTTTTQAVTEQDLDIRFYPGAVVVSGGRTETKGAGKAWAVAELVTGDPFDKVAAFYRKAYGAGNQVVAGRGSLTIIVDSGDRGAKTISVLHDPGATATRITLTSGSP